MLSAINEIMFLIMLSVPTIWEISNDWNGDDNKTWDVVVRIGLMVVSSVIVWKWGYHGLLDSFLMSVGIFFLFFDYIITWRLINSKKIEAKGAHWFTTTGKKGRFDNINLWLRIGPWGRLAAKAVFLIFVSLFYFNVI